MPIFPTLLNVSNLIAMVIGYIVLVVMIAFFGWVFIDKILEARKLKKIGQERAERDKVKKVLAEKQEFSKAEGQPTLRTAQNQPTAPQQPKKEENLKEDEKLVNESGKIKMVG
jgi:F0F1-type ATP synthase membrane subunit b/b'